MMDAGPFSLSIFLSVYNSYLSSVSLFRSLKLLGFVINYLPLKLATGKVRKKLNTHKMGGWVVGNLAILCNYF